VKKLKNGEEGGRVGHVNENEQLAELGEPISMTAGRSVFGGVVPLLKFRYIISNRKSFRL